jgi:hypothetical protein
VQFFETLEHFPEIKYICLPKIPRDVAQPGSVLAWGARGRWFESSHPDFKSILVEKNGFFYENKICPLAMNDYF